FDTATTPPLKRLTVSANSSLGIAVPGGAKVINKIRVEVSVTRVRIESETGLPNGPAWSTSKGKCARLSWSRPMPSYDSPSCPTRHVTGGVSFSASYNPIGHNVFKEK